MHQGIGHWNKNKIAKVREIQNSGEAKLLDELMH